MKLPHPFLQLPLKFDAPRLFAEVDALGEACWMEHPQKFPGNSMLPLIAVNGDPSNERFDGPMLPTPHLLRCEYLCQVIATLGVTVGRTRLMRLDGEAEVTPHADQGYYWVERMRVHVPIVTQPSVMFHCGDTTVNMAAGECWIFDTWRLHRVVNAHPERRIHLVVDTVGGPGFWALADKAKPYPSSAAEKDWTPHLVEYDPGANREFAVESTNVPTVMTPWEVEAHLTFLLREAPQHSIAPLLPHVDRLCRDWKALWAQHGTKLIGHDAYRRRMHEFLVAVHPTAIAVHFENGANLFGAIQVIVGRTAVTLDAPSNAQAMADRA